MNNIINVISYVIKDTDNIIIFTDTGEIHNLNSENYNLNKIINKLSTIPSKLCLNKYLTATTTKTVFKLFDIEKLNTISLEEFNNSSDIINNVDNIVMSKDKVIIGLNNDLLIPFADKLKHYINPNQSKKGLKNFITKLKVIHSRSSHTCEELLNFLEKAELPLTNEGNIVGYKKLQTSKNMYVDIYTKKVKQNVNYSVIMNKKDVDNSRNNDCSNGLHVASLNYLSSFGSSHYESTPVFLVVVNPYDVISVPTSDTTKLRCSKYNIIAKLNETAFNNIHNGKVITSDEETSKLLSNILKGNYKRPENVVTIDRDGNTISTYNKQTQEVNKVTNKLTNSLKVEKNNTKNIIKDLKSLLKKLKKVQE
jgi:hypothetical protein